MSSEIVGALEITGGLDELGDMIEEACGELEISGATHPGHKRAFRRLKDARQKQMTLVQALRAARQPQVRQRAETMGELPFPLGSATITASSTGNCNNTAQGTFRVERLIIDEASASPAPWLLQVDDVLLGNISQNLSAGAALATFYGPGAFYTPFKGSTIAGGLSARVNFTNLDSGNSRKAYSMLFGNSIR